MRDEIADDAVIMGDIAQLVYTGTAGHADAICPVPGFIRPVSALSVVHYRMPSVPNSRCPDKTVIALVGDGGFMFTVNELATAVEEGLSIPIIIWHNHSYAMIRDGMVKRGIPEIGVNPKAPDFIKLADAFGCPGVNVASEDEFRVALRNACQYAGPSLIIATENDAWLT